MSIRNADRRRPCRVGAGFALALLAAPLSGGGAVSAQDAACQAESGQPLEVVTAQLGMILHPNERVDTTDRKLVCLLQEGLRAAGYIKTPVSPGRLDRFTARGVGLLLCDYGQEPPESFLDPGEPAFAFELYANWKFVLSGLSGQLRREYPPCTAEPWASYRAGVPAPATGTVVAKQDAVAPQPPADFDAPEPLPDPEAEPQDLGGTEPEPDAGDAAVPMPKALSNLPAPKPAKSKPDPEEEPSPDEVPAEEVASAPAKKGEGMCEPKPVSAGCEDPRRSKDPDLRANADKILCAGLCLKSETLKGSGRTWKLQVIDNPDFPAGPRWLVPHDNENSAFDTAVFAVGRYGGRMVAVETGESRLFAGIDPNRSFGDAKSPSCKGRGKPDAAFTKRILELVGGGDLWLALHSNDAGYSGDGKGGRGHISAATTAGNLHGRMNGRAKGAFADSDNIVIIGGSTGPDEPDAVARIGRLHKEGMNVVYEQVTPAQNDCSMSNYLLLSGKARPSGYFNIEVQHCQTKVQMEMARRLLKMTGFRPVTKDKFIDQIPACPRK